MGTERLELEFNVLSLVQTEDATQFPGLSKLS